MMYAEYWPRAQPNNGEQVEDSRARAHLQAVSEASARNIARTNLVL